MASKLRSTMWWIVDHWQLPALLVVAVLGWLLLRWRRTPSEGILQTVQGELDIIRAGSKAREMQLQLGTEQTLEHVKDKYAAKTVALDATQQLKVKELEDDPVALAKYLERITRG